MAGKGSWGLWWAGAWALAASAVASTAAAADLAVLQVAPLTGVSGGLGWHMQVGAQVAFDSVNAAGGINGQRLRLVSVDEDPGHVANQVRALTEKENPVAMLGTVRSATLDELLKRNLLQSLQLPVIGVGSGALAVHRQRDPLVYLTRASHGDELETVFRQMETMQTNRVALLTTDDKDGLELQELAKELAARHGIKLVALAAHPADTAMVEDAVRAIQKVPHQAVVLASNTAAVAYFCKLYRKDRGTGQLVALSSAEATQLAQVVGKEAAHGVMISQVVPNPRNARVELMREFEAAYRKYGPQDIEPTLTMTEAYVNARVLIAALQRMPGTPTRAALAKVLAAGDVMDLSGYRIALHPEQGPRHSTSVSMIDRDGRVVY